MDTADLRQGLENLHFSYNQNSVTCLDIVYRQNREPDKRRESHNLLQENYIIIILRLLSS